jgi:beta-glucosidase
MNKGPTLPVNESVNDLISQMSLEEKISQMVYDAPGIERLGIPKYNWWNEILHGLGRAGVATVFPQAIGLAATWNPDLLYRVASAASDEARAKHHHAVRRGVRQIYTGLTFWSPNINLFRDPRWGRGQETYGEDPYLTAQMGVAFVRGLQGDDPRYLKLVATPKHYAVHSGPESDRHHFDAQVSEGDMREFYLFAFEACIKQGKAASIMGAYNRVNGEPCCASPTLLQTILREEWGFDGYVVSDCGAILDIYEHHKVKKTPAEAAAFAVQNGCELNCGSVYPALLEAVEQGLISEDIIDRAVERLFVARQQLGMFDPDEKVPFAQIPIDVLDSAEHRALALETARESIVLLKNEGNLLPLKKNLTSIAVIGPNADELGVLLGNYSGTPKDPVTPLEGIRRKVSSSTEVYHAQGCGIAVGVPPLRIIPASYLHPDDSDRSEFGLSALYYDNNDFTGEPLVNQVDPEINFTWKDTTPLSGKWGDRFSVKWDGYLHPPVSGTYQIGVNGYSVYELRLDGKLILENETIHHPVLKTREIKLEAGRSYRIQLAYVNQGLDPQVQLLWSLPGVDYEAQAMEVAKKADVVVLVMGLSPTLEGEEMPVNVEGFAGGDRTDIQLPRTQENLLKKIHALGKPVVLVLLNGSALAVNWAAKHAPAILEAWYPGQAGGEAIADVLFGDYNPSGKLPVTFYKSVEDLPSFEDYQLEGHTYRYFRGEPLFPFGYGLSYTTFQFDNLRCARNEVEVGGDIAVSVDVSNTGEREGNEVVQLYIRRPDASFPRPIKELKGFKRVTLAPRERKTVTFSLHTHQLGIYDEAMCYVVLPGIIEVMVGSSSGNLPLKGMFEIAGQPANVGKDKIFFSQVQVTWD